MTSDIETERDTAYRERAHLLAWLALLYPSVIAPAPDVDEPGWQLLYLTAGGSQMSWHVSPVDADLFAYIEHVSADDVRAQWDGHSTEEKYWKIRSLTFGEFRVTRLDEAHAAGVTEGEQTGRRVAQKAIADMLDSRFDSDGYGEWQDGWRAAAKEARLLII